MLDTPRANPRTSLAGLAGFLALLAGAIGTSSSGRWWPLLVGALLARLADTLGHLLAADGRPVAIPAPPAHTTTRSTGTSITVSITGNPDPATIEAALRAAIEADGKENLS